MTTFPNAAAARAHLAWLDDDLLTEVVEIARPFLDCEERFIGSALAWLEIVPDGLRGQPHEPAVCAILYLARHGIPHGLPSPD